MRSDPGAARLTVAAAGTALLLVAATAVPLATGAPRPTIPDLLVIAGFGAAAARLAMAGRNGLATTLWLSAALWTMTGLATSMPDSLGLPVARLALVPHALVVVALATTQTSGRRVAVPAILAAVAALAAGSGVEVPVLALLGSALLATVVLAQAGYAARRQGGDGGSRGRSGRGRPPGAGGRTWTPVMLATVVDLLLLGIAATATRQVTADPMTPFDVASGHDGRDEVGTWLARVLGAPPLQVAFPSGHGAVDSGGHPASYGREALRVRDERGVVAYVTPAVQVDQAVHEPLVAMLRRLGEVARLRAECREQADAIVASRGRLQAAADEESRRLERQLDDTLLARLDRIDELLVASSGALLTARVQEVRVELLRHARGLDPLAGRSLADALAAHRAHGTRVDVGELGEVDPSCARTAWYVATEGITNAIKHAPGSSVRLEVAREGDTLRVVVRDRGPGGADPHGAGLQGLADRVAAAGGELSIASGPDGTTLTCALPCTGFPAAGSRDSADPLPAGKFLGSRHVEVIPLLVSRVVGPRARHAHGVQWRTAVPHRRHHRPRDHHRRLGPGTDRVSVVTCSPS